LPVNKQPNIAFSYDDHIEFYSKSFKVVPLDIFMDYDEDFGKTQLSKYVPHLVADPRSRINKFMMGFLIW
ncbi:MAG: hypothetical protein Q8853_02670, partial [Candidatus Phytoplasma australasiaticum]|nr:hypothetical protein [Candidatus Phytoplasma australasiaticum]